LPATGSVVGIIGGDKTKTQAYCQLIELGIKHRPQLLPLASDNHANPKGARPTRLCRPPFLLSGCLSSPAKAPTSGPGWRGVIQRAAADYTRANDFSSRFPFIAMALAKLPVRSCLIDGEAIVCDENGLAVFELIRGHGSKASAVLCAFDLLELDGKDLRRQPIEIRKHLLAKLLKAPHLSIVLNEHFEEDGALVFGAACQLGCEGVVSKRLGSPYRSGRSALWMKVKNPKAPAAKREAEEDWRR
jgi:bifunctional non-homologous end joining protein LigD